MSLPSLPKIDDINPFAEKEVPLPGKRVSVIQQENITSDLAAADRPITLPPPRQNDSWSQPGGVPNNAPGHLALAGAVKSAWSADAGTGSSFYGKLTASPIVYDDKVYTLDAAGKVVGLQRRRAARRSGRPRPRRPTRRTRKGFGGGLAADGGRIYAATGFGYVVALDANTGKKLWEKNVGSPVRTSPTAAAERVFVVTKEGQVYLPVGLRRHRAVDLPRHGRAGQPALQRQPGGRRRHRRRALSDRRPGGAARRQRPAGVVGVAGAHAHGLLAWRP